MTIGKRIRYERLKRGLSQEELAKALSTTKQAIYKYENEIVTNIPMDKISKLAEIFNTTPAYIMGWEEESPSNDKLSEEDLEILELIKQVPELKELVKMATEIPEEKLKSFLEMGRLYSDSLKKG